jgi:hypothetical protein
MTEEQQRIAIAEACGYTHVRIVKAIEGPPDIGIGHHPTEPHSIPDYLNDLNAMHEAEKIVLSNSGLWTKYVSELRLQSALTGLPHFHIPADQRAEALLRTIGKWGRQP